MNHTVLFMGMASFQVIFVFYQYILFKRKEFIYYILYSLCVSVFILLKTFPQYDPLRNLVTREDHFTAGRGLLLVGYAMYYRFGRYFTETQLLYKKLNRVLICAEWIFIIYGVFDMATQFAGIDYFVIEPISQKIYLAAMPFSFYVIIYLITRKRKLTSILVIGSGLLLLFASASFIDLIFITKRSLPDSHYMIYMEAGILSEFLFLNYGLIYKTRMLQMENMQLEVEKQVELYKQRMRISSDLHDEVGATLSGIAMYTQITKEQIRLQEINKVQQSLTVMQQSAAEMVDKLNEIVWTVNPEQDSLQKLLQRLEEYAQEMGAIKNIKVHSSIGSSLEEVKLPMDARRNIYLLCKEAINNTVKYSNCSELTLLVTSCNDNITFIVQDNGTGFDIKLIKKGNGINNMIRRADALNTSLKINSATGKGTRITLEIKIPH